MAFVLFIFEITLTLSFDDEDKPANIAYVALMYFTYCQLWVYVIVKALYQEYIKKEKRTWVKTVRFDVKKTEAVGE